MPVTAPDREVDVLIVGAGAAGAACAETLATAGFDGSVLLAGRELDPPYDRPLVSKGYLQGRVERDATYVRPGEWWAEHGVELLARTSVMKLDTTDRVATLSNKTAVGFRHAVLATGANVRRLRVDGAELDGIHYLRALGNADALRADVEGAERIVLVGGSYIACEVAASLTSLGKRCTLVMQEELPLSRGFGPTAGRLFGEMLREQGIDWHGGQALARFEGDGRVGRVVTEAGLELEADAVVMGTGAAPDVMLARSAGLALGETGGVACDARLRTSAPGVWAAGDACEFECAATGGRTRIEHWEVARGQGRAVAAGIMGEAAGYDEVPYFWSDLGDWCTVEWVGHARPWDREVLQGSPGEDGFSLSYLEGDRLVAALAVGRPDDLELARRRLVG